MKLNSSLFSIPFVNNVLYYDTITSTNDKAKELALRGVFTEAWLLPNPKLKARDDLDEASILKLAKAYTLA